MQYTLTTYPTPGYAERTRVNAKSADLTVAFARDFTTAGERLTQQCAGKQYVAIPLTLTVQQAAQKLQDAMENHNAYSLNIAGNGIYTLAKYDWEQSTLNAYIYAVLCEVNHYRSITAIRSGGQTGVDWAGLVAGVKLDIPTTGLFPLGFLQRHVDGVDRRFTQSDLEHQLEADVAELPTIEHY